MLKKAIIYCRTACKEQKNKDLNLIGQSEVCLAFAEETGRFKVIKVVTDNGISGIADKQGRLVKLFGVLKQKGAEALITYDATRISRSYEEYMAFKRSLDIAGIELVTVMPDLNELNDQFMRHYKQELSKRIKRGISEARRRKINMTINHHDNNN